MHNPKQYLADFESNCEFFVAPGDAGATTLGSTAAVILAAACTGSRNSLYLGELTGLPSAFASMVVTGMGQKAIWAGERGINLAETLAASPNDYMQVLSALHSVVEEFWTSQSSGLPATYYVFLERLRGGIIFGGVPEADVDPESVITCSTGTTE